MRWERLKYRAQVILRGECEPCRRRKRALLVYGNLALAILRATPRRALDLCLGRPVQEYVKVQGTIHIVTLSGVMHRALVKVRTVHHRRPRWPKPVPGLTFHIASIDFGPDPVPVPMHAGHPRGPVDWVYQIEDICAGNAQEMSVTEVARLAAQRCKSQLMGERQRRGCDPAWQSHAVRPYHPDIPEANRAGIKKGMREAKAEVERRKD
jgi:hypothetical protein